MSIAALTWAFNLEIRPSSLKFLLVSLADHSNVDAEVWPSVETLAHKTSMDRKTVIHGIDELERLGFLVDTNKRKGKTGQVKVYRLEGFQGEIPKSSENGMVQRVPFFPPNSTVSTSKSTVFPSKASQKRYTESSLNLKSESLGNRNDLPTTWSDELRAEYPARSGHLGIGGMKLLLKVRSALTKASWSEILEGVKRYAAYCEKAGITGSEFVKAPANFFEEGLYLETFVHQAPKSREDLAREESKAREAERWAAARRDGERLADPVRPYPHESVGAYETRVRLAGSHRRLPSSQIPAAGESSADHHLPAFRARVASLSRKLTV